MIAYLLMLNFEVKVNFSMGHKFGMKILLQLYDESLSQKIRQNKKGNLIIKKGLELSMCMVLTFGPLRPRISSWWMSY